MKQDENKKTKSIQETKFVCYSKVGSTDGSNTLEKLIKIQQQNKDSKKRKR